MKTLRERVEERIRQAICKACIYETAGGGCSFGGRTDCPILERLDKIIEVVRSTRSTTIDAYVQRLRDEVCAECINQSPDGRCALRDHADCPLDDYFVLLVEIIEEEAARTETVA